MPTESISSNFSLTLSPNMVAINDQDEQSRFVLICISNTAARHMLLSILGFFCSPNDCLSYPRPTDPAVYGRAFSAERNVYRMLHTAPSSVSPRYFGCRSGATLVYPKFQV